MSTYKLINTLLGTCTAGKDLDVWFTNDLTWNKQVYEQSARANKLLGYIKEKHEFHPWHRSKTNAVLRLSTTSSGIRHSNLGTAVHRTHC